VDEPGVWLTASAWTLCYQHCPYPLWLPDMMNRLYNISNSDIKTISCNINTIDIKQ